MTPEHGYQVVVIGGSAGGAESLRVILSVCPPDFSLPILVAQHLHPSDGGSFARHLALATQLLVIEPCDKQPIERGCVYTAPANYHMLLERSGQISLSVDGKVNWSRPSIDVLFESAVYACGDGVVAVLLSGASSDGADGIRRVRAVGGLTIVQEPRDAGVRLMPQSAINTKAVDEVLPAEAIGRRLIQLGTRCKAWPAKGQTGDALEGRAR
jgi:two-component system chemotaxis response regulator CheB